LKEYLQHLYIALGSMGESVSALLAYRNADQITEEQFASVNDLAYKLENGLLKLVESLERKQETGDWIDSLVIHESNAAYGEESALHYSATPSLRSSPSPPA
jgi:hypothetical protein